MNTPLTTPESGTRLGFSLLLGATLMATACDTGAPLQERSAPTVNPSPGSTRVRSAEDKPLAAGPPPLPASVDGQPFQRGMVYGIFSRSGRHYHRANLEAMRDLGVNSIEIVVPRAMATVRSTELSAANRSLTPSRESVAQAVSEAHRLGLQVLLFPIVFVEQLEAEEWRGTLAPVDWDLWWRNYGAFILDEARWAEQHGIEMLSVGSELGSTERFTGRWVDLIRDVRQVYSGQVTYTANWDHLDTLEFAGHTDFIGMNAYHEVGSTAPDLDELVQQWISILAGIEAWQSTHGRPVVVTEIGYQSRRGTTLRPWDYMGEGELDLAEQELGYRAFIQAWSSMPWLAGTYFYMWWDEDDGGRGYTPREKPAGETLRRWYTQQ